MQWTTLCIVLLAISEPLLSCAKKLVVMVPRQVKRSPAIPWRPGPMHYRKSAHGNDFRHHGYYSRPAPYYSKRPYHRPPPYSHSEDDFDQGYDSQNHVHIPYGKDMGHGMHYGKGYNPYDSMKVGYSYGRESRYPRYKPKYMEPDYPPTSYSSTGPDYPTGQSYDGPHMDAMFPDLESALDYRERRNDRKKYYASRSIGKEHGLKAQFDLNSLLEKEKEQLQQQQQQLQHQQLQQQQLQQQQLQHQQLQQQQLEQQQLEQQHLQQQQLQHQQPKASTAAEMYKEALSHGHDVQGAIILPSGIPPATIGGTKEGIVLRDTVALDDYHRKLEEITKSWPAFMNAGIPDGGASLQQQVHTDYPTAGLQGSSFTDSPSWFSDYAQAKQGYAVKEELTEPTHDFRNMPIQTTQYQSLPLSVNMGVPSLSQTVHG